MSPPAVMAEPGTGGNTKGRNALAGTQLELVISAAHTALAGCGVIIGPSRVARIVRRFSARAQRSGVTFHEFLSREANLTSRQRDYLLDDPTLAGLLAHSDPVGNEATYNVDRERGW